MSMKNSNDTVGNRTGDLPACSSVPQPNAPSRAPLDRGASTYVGLIAFMFTENVSEMYLKIILF
jgi:hypothetical protein